VKCRRRFSAKLPQEEKYKKLTAEMATHFWGKASHRSLATMENPRTLYNIMKTSATKVVFYVLCWKYLRTQMNSLEFISEKSVVVICILKRYIFFLDNFARLPE